MDSFNSLDDVEALHLLRTSLLLFIPIEVLSELIIVKIGFLVTKLWVIFLLLRAADCLVRTVKQGSKALVLT